ncbi:MAG: PKD domain-containing protein [Chitinophagales bacterium]
MKINFTLLLVLLNSLFVVNAQNNQLLYIENNGQWDNEIQYRAKLNHAQVDILADGMFFEVVKAEDLEAAHEAHHGTADAQNLPIHHHNFRLQFLNTQQSISTAFFKNESYYNYFLGNDPTRWASKVGLYQMVTQYQLYNGIDLKYYSTAEAMKFDILLAANSNPNDIAFSLEGVENIYLKNNALEIPLAFETLQFSMPFAYQFINGAVVQVACNYVLNENNVVTFAFPEGYNVNYDLVIDPDIIFATLTGANADNWGSTATYDQAGNFYGGGIGFNPFGQNGFPTTTGAFQTTFGGTSTDIAITKYSPDGTQLLYGTYLGGASSEFPHSMIVNTEGDLLILGTTSSMNFPMTSNSADNTFNGGNSLSVNNINYSNGSDIVVSRLSEDGSTLVGSTYFGGSGNDGLNVSNSLDFNYGDIARGEIMLDGDDNVYIASCSNSANLPTSTGSYQSIYGGNQDGVVAKFSADLSQTIAATYIGGSSAEGAYSIKVLSGGNLVVSGATTSNNFPTTGNAYKGTYNGGSADGFAAIFSNDLSSVNTATFLGTSGYDAAYFADIDSDENIYFLGQTQGNYPISENVYSGNGGQFIHKFNTDLSSSIWSTRFGTNNTINISPTAFLVDECNRIYVSGWGGFLSSNSTNGLSVTNDAYQNITDGQDFYFLVLEAEAAALNYATFFGDPVAYEHVDGGTSRFDKRGVIYQAVCAACGGNDFPTTPGVWSQTNGSSNCNMGSIKFAFDANTVVADFAIPDYGCAPFSITLTNNSLDAVSYLWDSGNGETSEEENPTFSYDTSGVYNIMLIATNPDACNVSDTLVKSITIQQAPDPYFPDGNFCFGSNAQPSFAAVTPGGTWSSNTININPVTGQFIILELEVGEYDVTYTVGEGDCTASFTQMIRVFATPDATFTINQNEFCADGILSAETTQPGGTLVVYYNDEEYPSENYNFDISQLPLTNYVNNATVSHVILGEYVCVDNKILDFTVYAQPEITITAGDCIPDGSGTFNAQISLSGLATETPGNITVSGNGIEVVLNAENPTTTVVLSSSETALNFSLYDDYTTCSGTYSFETPFCPTCMYNAGTMESSTQFICAGDLAQAAWTEAPTLEEGLSFVYIIHNGSGETLGTVYAQNTTGEFSIEDVPSYNVMYYISTAVGDDTGNGSIDLNDACTVISAGTPVVFLKPITIIDDIECLGDDGQFEAYALISGGYPSFNPNAYYIVTGDYTSDNTIHADQQFLINTFPDGSTYSVFAADEKGCEAAEPAIQEIVACYKLPTTLISFSGKIITEGNQLEWIYNNLSDPPIPTFIIEKSLNGIDFSNIAEVDVPLYLNSAAIDLDFLDTNFNTGDTYYRLKYIDMEGKQGYYNEIVLLTRFDESNINLHLTDKMLYCNLISENIAAINYQIFNVTGQQILSGKESFNPAYDVSSFHINLHSLLPGVYFIQIADGNNVLKTERFILH